MLLLKALLMTECVTQLDVRTAVPKVKMSISGIQHYTDSDVNSCCTFPLSWYSLHRVNAYFSEPHIKPHGILSSYPPRSAPAGRNFFVFVLAVRLGPHIHFASPFSASSGDVLAALAVLLIRNDALSSLPQSATAPTHT